MTSPLSPRLSYAMYLRVCRDEIIDILEDWFDIAVLADCDSINDSLRQARQAGVISREEYMDGLRADIIARDALDIGQTGPLAVMTTSYAFSPDDLETAARRAAVIAKVTGADTAAFVVTHTGWPDEADAAARQLGVTIIRYEDPYSQEP